MWYRPCVRPKINCTLVPRLPPPCWHRSSGHSADNKSSGPPSAPRPGPAPHQPAANCSLLRPPLLCRFSIKPNICLLLLLAAACVCEDQCSSILTLMSINIHNIQREVHTSTFSILKGLTTILVRKIFKRGKP